MKSNIERINGPIKIPMMPKALIPPSTPIKITSEFVSVLIPKIFALIIVSMSVERIKNPNKAIRIALSVFP